MSKFLVLYLVPASVIDDWMKTAPEKRKAAEEQMRDSWKQWMGDHADVVTDMMAAGKTTRVSAGEVAGIRNDIMLFSYVEADSREAAAKIFADHPHLQIPQSSIEVMEIRPMTGG